VVDQIELEGMSFKGRHGVRPAERESDQEFRVDVTVDCNLEPAGRTDRLEDTVDYTRVRAIAKAAVEGESRNLLETLAAEMASRILELPGVAGVSVRIAKRPQSLLPIDAAAVHIKRTRA
jgi:dihydroneopterin aldolase